MDNFTSRNGVSSRDRIESSKEESHFRNSKFGALRTTEGAYQASSSHREGRHGYSIYRWHEKKHSYGSAPSDTYPSDVFYGQEQKETRNPFGARHEDRSIYSNHRKSVAGQVSEEQYRYFKRHSYGSAPLETHPSDVAYSQDQEGARNPSGGHHVDTNIYGNCQKSIAGQLSKEPYRYHERHDACFPNSNYKNSSNYNNHQKYGGDWMSGGHYRHFKRRDTQMGTYLSEEGVHKYNNHPKSVNDSRSGENYRYHTQGRKQVGTSFSDAPHGDFSSYRYNNCQRSITGRMSEGSYRYYKQHEMQMDTCPKEAGSYNNCQESITCQTSEEKYRFYRLPGKQREWGHSSGNHAQPASLHLPESNPDVTTSGKDVRPFNGEHYKGTVWVATCSKDVASIAVSVKNVNIENDASLHGFGGKESASGYSVRDGKGEYDFDPRDTNNSSPEGTKKNLDVHVDVGNASGQSPKDVKTENDIESRDPNKFSPEGAEKNLDLNVTKHVNVGSNKAAMDEASGLGDAADALLQLGQIEVVAPSKSIFRISKKLIVLDLNGILVDINRVPNAAQIHSDREHINVSKKTAFKRPFCDEFLNFCFNVFDIGVWSSRMKHNVEVVVDYLMGNMKKKLLFCWDNEKCTYTGCNTIENAYKPLVLKELSKLWDKEEPELPWEKGAYSPSNTLLIDDSPYKALCNPPCTGIFPRPYGYMDANDNSLGPGGDLRVFLEGLVKADNVQEYVGKNPIGQSSITDNNKSWKFYLQVIERVEKGKKRKV